MYLKKLEIQGFKSFVNKTVLEFDKGITAIVGPNGSGKSNLSDAVRWVLGEQSPKTLRGGKMEDVIFAGTENKRAVGMAEVSLIMDNSDRTLNIDYTEVKITRRLYRSGESEYLLNGAACRLKDILMLFADTGIGRDGFSIISQGKVDEILNSKSDDRRNIFEDASGIMKYRMRKEESERKLNNTEQNLLRINDILGELERQIEPLTKQAEKAKKYLSLKYELRDIEVGALVDGINDANVKIEESQKNISILEEQISNTEVRLEEIKEENLLKTEKSKDLEERIYEEREKSHEIGNNIERINSSIKINENNIQTLRQACSRNEEEILNLTLRQNEITGNISSVDANIDDSDKKLSETRTQISEMNEKFAAVMSLLSDDAAKAEEVRDSLYESKLAYNQKVSERESCENSIFMIDKRNSDIKNEILLAEQDNERIGDMLRKSEEDYVKHVEETEKTKSEYSESTDNLNALKESLEKANEQLSETVSEYKARQARLRLLNEMNESYEGYARSVKEILSLCKMNNTFGKGIYGAVAEIINVPAEYEYAVETAIGQAYQNIVTASEEDAKKAIDYLKSRNLGRATFLPISAVTGRILEYSTVSQLKSMPGYIGVASDLVKFDRMFENIVNSLLGRVVIFKDLDSCINASKKFKYSFVCVTIDGDILRTSGAMTGGSKDTGKKTNVFARTREIPELVRFVEDAGRSIEDLKVYIQKLREDIRSLEQKANSLSNSIRHKEVTAERFKNTYNSFVEKKENNIKRIRQLMSEAEKGIADISGLKEKINAINQMIEKIQAEIEEKQDELSVYEEKSVQGSAVRTALTNELTKVQIKENELKNLLNNFLAEKKRLNDEITNITERRNYLRLQIDEDLNKIKEYSTENEEFIRSIKIQNEAKTGNNLLLEQLTEEKREIDKQLSGMIERISEVNSEIAVLKEEMSRLLAIRAKYEGEKEFCQNRLWEEYELTYSKACEICVNTRSVNKEERRKRINELKNAMKNLGNVNVGAIEELEVTKNRYEFMSSNYNDMYQAKLKLQKVIAEMNQVMKEQFTLQFENIRKNFNEVFVELFGGGKADIVLTDAANVLESGIEINVQPPGKKLQNMLLLSGGERAMTAIALLFAILRLRPSPFCLLDEIEASLDEANVYRLGRFLIKATEQSQFIMVTHRKGTMEISETLYGVTMEEKGVSKVVSMKLGGEAQ